MICNLYFADYRSLLCLPRSLLIKYSFAAPPGHLILHQNFLNIRLFHSYPCIHSHTWIHNLNIYIYLSDYQVGSNISYNNWKNHYISRLHLLHETIELNIKTIKSFVGRTSSITTAPEWFSSVNQVKLGKHCKPCKNPLKTEWTRLALTFLFWPCELGRS